MDPTSDVGLNPTPRSPPTRSRLLSHNLKNFFSKKNIMHPEKNFTAQLHEAEIEADISYMHAYSGLPKSSAAPIPMATSEDYTPHPERSLPLSKERQSLVDDVVALYSCHPTAQRVRRYTPDCVYDDQFVYANNRHKVAGQWFVLPKLFSKSVNEGYEIVRSDDEMIQFKIKQSWTFRVISDTVPVTSLVSLTLDPATRDTDFMQIKYHKERANAEGNSHEGMGFSVKKWQAYNVAMCMNAPEVREFEADRNAAKEPVRKYWSWKGGNSAPKHNFTT